MFYNDMSDAVARWLLPASETNYTMLRRKGLRLLAILQLKSMFPSSHYFCHIHAGGSMLCQRSQGPSELCKNGSCISVNLLARTVFR